MIGKQLAHAPPSHFENKDIPFLLSSIRSLQQYAINLETQKTAPAPAAAAPVAPAAPPRKTPEQIQTEVARLRSIALKQIKAQFKWKPSCKTGGAKWSYQGICDDPVVFAAMVGEETTKGGSLKWKRKKITNERFEELFGSASVGIRYGCLNLTKENVNIGWAADSGEFTL
ncbi:hypothetical protein HK102_008730, partial [Quaeritorhiza haematococci]